MTHLIDDGLSLLAQNDTLQSLYQTKKREYRENESMTEKKDSQGSRSNERISESPVHSIPESFLESIFKEFVNEIKVAGIRAPREKILLEKLEHVQKVLKEMISNLKSQITEVESQVEYFKETLLELNQDHTLKCDQMETVISKKAIELQKAKNELKNVSEKLKLSKEENQSLITRHEEELNSFLKRLEDEIKIIKETADAKFNELKRKNDKEKQEILHDLQVTRVALKEEENHRLHLQHLERERSESASKVREELMGRIHELEETLGSFRCETDQLNEEIQSLTREHDENLQAEKLLRREMENRHDNEMKEIENRIKILIASHDATLKEEKTRTAKAEKRATEFERCIKRLENGL